MWRWLVRRDWRYAVVMVCYLSNYLPWFMNLDRQMYFFYATSMAPFLVMGLALILGDILGADGRFASFGRERRTIGILIVTTYMGLCVVNFVWLWPILTGYPVSQEIWNQQLWLPSWR
jgi:dolichyl-phosphate-mannose--protein O-mannosyl transferase